MKLNFIQEISQIFQGVHISNISHKKIFLNTRLERVVLTATRIQAGLILINGTCHLGIEMLQNLIGGVRTRFRYQYRLQATPVSYQTPPNVNKA